MVAEGHSAIMTSKMSLARKYRYRRRLPHIQANAVTVDFVTQHRWILPELARDVVFNCCLHENRKTIDLFACVVMPDHVHLLFRALRDEDGWPYSLPEIIKSIKGLQHTKLIVSSAGPARSGRKNFSITLCELPSLSPARLITFDSILSKAAW